MVALPRNHRDRHPSAGVSVFVLGVPARRPFEDRHKVAAERRRDLAALQARRESDPLDEGADGLGHLVGVGMAGGTVNPARSSWRIAMPISAVSGEAIRPPNRRTPKHGRGAVAGNKIPQRLMLRCRRLGDCDRRHRFNTLVLARIIRPTQ